MGDPLEKATLQAVQGNSLRVMSLRGGGTTRVMSVNRGVVEGVGWWETPWRKLHYRLEKATLQAVQWKLTKGNVC